MKIVTNETIDTAIIMTRRFNLEIMELSRFYNEIGRKMIKEAVIGAFDNDYDNFLIKTKQKGKIINRGRRSKC